MSVFHVPVLLNEVVAALNIQKNAWYVDGTAGGGGHSMEILRAGSKVLMIDQDQEAIDRLNEKFAHEAKIGTVILRQGNFKDLKTLVKETHIENIKGVLLDLGLSTDQLVNSGRGFSFMRDENLDMRMSLGTDVSASDIVNTYSEEELYELFITYGEEIMAGPIARTIVSTRSVKPITKSAELAEIIKGVGQSVGFRQTRTHPATRVFQALRIAVNNELKSLQAALPQALELLTSQGRLVVISFHSLEDRIVKSFFVQKKQEGLIEIVTKKPIIAGSNERRQNASARSAKMRVVEKIEENLCN